MDAINVTIKNFIGRDRLLTWLPKGQKWIKSNGTLTIPYEPWGSANAVQREAISAALADKSIGLTLYVMGVDGQVHAIPYNPAYGYVPKQIPGKPMQMTQNQPKKNNNAFEPDSKSHIVVASGANAGAQYSRLGFSQETVEPPKSVDPDKASQVGFIKESNGNVDRLKQNLVEQAEVAPEEEPTTQADIKDAFAALVDSKQWDEALTLLKDFFGEDKITFNARTIMSMKSYDAIVAKYNL